MKKLLLLALTLAAAFWIVRSLRPDPVSVETATVTRGPMSVSIEEEGETRAQDRFVVAAPIAGRMDRIHLREGDRIAAGQTLTRISPQPLDPRSRAEASARVASAKSLYDEAEDHANAEQAKLQLARRERQRAETLHRSGDIALDRVEQARTAETTAARDWEAARHRLEAARHDVETARAALSAESPASNPGSGSVTVRSPVAGRLLQIFEESERIVAAGAPIVSIGNAGRLEVVIDVLSSDAVRIRPGARVWLDDWGGDHALHAVVRVIEPQAFKKVSALGVEERRVHIVADFTDPPGRLGDGYRVQARIEIWHAGDVIKIPADAAFRTGPAWTVFVAESVNGKTIARLRQIDAGHRGDEELEVTKGLEPGETVIVRPPRDLEERTQVTPAPTGQPKREEIR
ncbi:MAG: efflux RND transporter periplasmic adaptor subunit [Bryobacteraceae bacterium]